MSPGFVVVDGEKGGVGKSFTCQALVSWALDRKIPVVVIDANERIPDVARRYTGVVPVHVVNVKEEGGWTKIVDIAANCRTSLNRGILALNLPGNVISSFPEHRTTMFRAMKRSLGYRNTLVWTMDLGEDVVVQLGPGLGPIIEFVDGRVALRNTVFGREEQFTVWHNSRMRKRFIEVGGLDYSMPRLWPEVARLISQPTVSTYRTHDRALMGFGEFAVLEDWVARADRLFDNLRPCIGV